MRQPRDWVFGTAWSNNGARLVSGSRDKAVKLIEVASGRLIDDVNRTRDPIQCLARHPHEDLVVFGDDKGGIRIHKMEPRGGRLAEGDDKENSFVRECDRLPGPVQALAWSPDGNLIAAGSATGEVFCTKPRMANASRRSRSARARFSASHFGGQHAARDRRLRRADSVF